MRCQFPVVPIDLTRRTPWHEPLGPRFSHHILPIGVVVCHDFDFSRIPRLSSYILRVLRIHNLFLVEDYLQFFSCCLSFFLCFFNMFLMGKWIVFPQLLLFDRTGRRKNQIWMETPERHQTYNQSSRHNQTWHMMRFWYEFLPFRRL